MTFGTNTKSKNNNAETSNVLIECKAWSVEFLAPSLSLYTDHEVERQLNCEFAKLQASEKIRIMEDKGKGTDRWSGAVANLSEMASNLESLQKLLLKKAVYVDDETFARASLCSEQARTIKVTRLALAFFFLVCSWVFFDLLFPLEFRFFDLKLDELMNWWDFWGLIIELPSLVLPI